MGASKGREVNHEVRATYAGVSHARWVPGILWPDPKMGPVALRHRARPIALRPLRRLSSSARSHLPVLCSGEALRPPPPNLAGRINAQAAIVVSPSSRSSDSKSYHYIGRAPAKSMRICRPGMGMRRNSDRSESASRTRVESSNALAAMRT